MNWRYMHRVWAPGLRPRKQGLGVQTLCMAILLLAFAAHDARADCPAAPIADADDMVVSFLSANGTQAAPSSLLPSSVKEGMLVYDDTANKLKVCNGTAWVDVGSGSGTDTLAALSCASGEIAKYNGSAWACAADGGGGGGVTPVATSVAVPSSSTTSTTITDMTGATVTFTSNGLPTLVMANFTSYSNTASATGTFQLVIDGTVESYYTLQYSGSTLVMPTSLSVLKTLTAGSHTAKLRWLTNTGTLTANWNSGATSLIVHEIGGGGGSDTLSGLSCATNEIPKWNGGAWACAADGGGGAAGTAPSYLIKGMSAGQSSLAAGTVIQFTTQVSSGGSKITHSGNRITVAGGSSYMLRAFIRQGTASSAVDYGIYNVTNSAFVPATSASANTSTNFSDTDVMAFVAPSASTTYEVRVYNGGGSALAGYSSFSAVELSGGSDTLSGLSCATNEIPKWNGTAWACAADGGGSGSGQHYGFSASKSTAGTFTSALCSL